MFVHWEWIRGWSTERSFGCFLLYGFHPSYVREGEGILDDGSNLLSLWGDAPLFFFNHHHVYLSLHRGMEVYTEIQGIIFDTRHSRVNFAESLSTCFRALIQWANFWIIPISIERSVTGLYSFRALCSDNSGHDNLFEQIAITACSKFSLVSCIRTLDEMFCFLHCNSIICKFLQFFLFHLILLMVAKDFQTGMSFHRETEQKKKYNLIMLQIPQYYLLSHKEYINSQSSSDT